MTSKLDEAQMAADFASIPHRSDGSYQKARHIVERYHSRIGAVHVERALIEEIACEIDLAELRALGRHQEHIAQTLLNAALNLSAADQYRLAFQIAENIGCTVSRAEAIELASGELFQQNRAKNDAAVETGAECDHLEQELEHDPRAPFGFEAVRCKKCGTKFQIPKGEAF